MSSEVSGLDPQVVASGYDLPGLVHNDGADGQTSLRQAQLSLLYGLAQQNCATFIIQIFN